MFITPAQHKWPAVKQGDTFPDVPMVIGKDLTGCTLKMAFTNNAGQVMKQVTINITDATGGAFTLQKWLVTLPPATYKADLDITEPGGDNHTYLESTLDVKAQNS